MKSYVTIGLTAYEVEFVDLREPQPRAHHTELHILTNTQMAALEALSLDVQNYIRERFAKGGFHVLCVRKVKGGSVEASRDLSEVYRAATSSTESEPEQVGNRCSTVKIKRRKAAGAQ